MLYVNSISSLVISLSIVFVPAASCYRILGIFPHNGKSHFMMNEQLLKGLAERGHQVDVVSHFPLKKPFDNYNQVVDLRGTIPLIQNSMTYDSANRIPQSVVYMAATTYGGMLCDLMGQQKFKDIIKNPPTDPSYDLVIVNMLGSSCYLALGQHFKVPIVGTVSSVLWPWVNGIVANPDNPAYIPEVFSGLSGPMNFWQRMQNTLRLMSDKWQYDYYSVSQDEFIKKHIGPNSFGVREAERNVSLILTNAHHSLNGVRPYTTAVVEVGGLHIPKKVDALPKELEKWLNDSKDGFIYMSFGSMITIESFPKDKLEAIYTSVAKLSPVRVLIKIVEPEKLPDGLPENVYIDSWIPQLAVLQHKNVRAFVTHGGLMSTQEAAYCGVPMIGIPFFTDQPQNMKVFVRKNAAVVLDHKELSVEKLDAAFNVVLKDPSYMIAAKKLSSEFRDNPMSPLDTAIFWIEYVIRHGGTNIRSPAMDLTWWQIALIDVYAVLISFVVSTMCLTVFLITKFIKTIFKSEVKMTSSVKKIE